jgi:hypothetical protein
MAFTRHGYHIAGTVMGENTPQVKRCGGPELCNQCKADVDMYWGSVGRVMEVSREDKLKEIVRRHVISELPPDHSPIFEVRLVFFAYILGGYKATISTNLKDQKYYEVTYDLEKRRTYLDVYEKTNNIVIDD